MKVKALVIETDGEKSLKVKGNALAKLPKTKEIKEVKEIASKQEEFIKNSTLNNNIKEVVINNNKVTDIEHKNSNEDLNKEEVKEKEIPGADEPII